MKLYLSVLTVAAALAGSGLAAPAAAPAKRVLPDAQIERTIKAKLAKSKMAATEHFTVSVQNGVATFEGTTNVIQHKGVATRMAKSAGAVAVQNHIKVSEAAKAAAAAKLAKYRGGVGGGGAPMRAAVLPAAKPK